MTASLSCGHRHKLSLRKRSAEEGVALPSLRCVHVCNARPFFLPRACRVVAHRAKADAGRGPISDSGAVTGPSVPSTCEAEGARCTRHSASHALDSRRMRPLFSYLPPSWGIEGHFATAELSRPETPRAAKRRTLRGGSAAARALASQSSRFRVKRWHPFTYLPPLRGKVPTALRSSARVGGRGLCFRLAPLYRTIDFLLQ